MALSWTVKGLNYQRKATYINVEAQGTAEKTGLTLNPGCTRSVFGFSTFALPLSGRDGFCLAFADFCAAFTVLTGGILACKVKVLRLTCCGQN
jgi:hypothetical protein